MIGNEERQRLSKILQPASPPREIDNVYTQEQLRRLLDVVHDQGEWKLIIAQHFANAEELIATFAGGFPEGFEPTLDMFLTPTFRGFYGNYSTALYQEISDLFYNQTFIEHAKSYWMLTMPSRR